jgi:GNAT superfamily N-acetyltransferase
LTPTIRPPHSDGERSLIVEATCHARQPMYAGRHVIPWTAWLAMYSPAVYEALRNGKALVADLEGVAVGFVVCLYGRLMMVYVKQEFRGWGTGYRLIAAAQEQGALELPLRVTADMLTPSWFAWTTRRGLRYQTETARAA